MTTLSAITLIGQLIIDRGFGRGYMCVVCRGDSVRAGTLPDDIQHGERCPVPMLLHLAPFWDGVRGDDAPIDDLSAQWLTGFFIHTRSRRSGGYVCNLCGGHSPARKSATIDQIVHRERCVVVPLLTLAPLWDRLEQAGRARVAWGTPEQTELAQERLVQALALLDEARRLLRYPLGDETVARQDDTQQ